MCSYVNSEHVKDEAINVLVRGKMHQAEVSYHTLHTC